MRVIVIGSGIAGLSCAVALRRIGHEVALYERAPELREVGAGIMIWANAVRALTALGVWESVRAVSEPVVGGEMSAKNGFKRQMTFTADQMDRDAGLSPAVCFAHRAELVAVLAGHLPPGVARYGHECVGVEERGERVAARFANGHEDEAELLVGADGIRSAVRASLFGPGETRYAGYTCWRGIAPRPAGLKPGELKLWVGRGSQVGMNPLPGDRVYWFATKNAPPGGKAADEQAAALDVFRDWAPPLPAVIAATPADRVIRADILDRPPSRPWSKGRAVLVGDAAHPTTPNFGQGGCLAMEDAVVLARCLAADPGGAAAAFERERYPRTSAVTNEAWKFGKMLQWEGPVSCWFRDALSGLLIPLGGTKNLVKHARFDAGALP